MQKQANSVGSALPDPAADAAAAESIPAPSVSNKPPPGQTGPKGLQPRQTYSRVNTGTPQTPEAGAAAFKGMAPRGLEFLPKLSEARMNTTVTSRPTLNDMVKAAMAGAIDRVSITDEAVRQIGGTVKSASAPSSTPESLPTDLLNKLADALGYVADQIEKGAAIQLPAPAGGQPAPGSGPGALKVMKAEHEGPAPLAPGQSGGKAEAGAPMESGKHGPAPANAMGTNENMHHGSWPADVMNGKTASDKLVATNLERLSKVGFAVTQRGHDFDAAMHEMKARHMAEQMALHDHFSGGRFGLSDEAKEQIGGPEKGTIERLVDIVRFGGHEQGLGGDPRHHEYVAAKHREGKNAWNPLGGIATPSKHEVGGHPIAYGAYKSKAPEMPKESSVISMIRKAASAKKVAEDANNPAQISAGKEPGPAASGTASGEAVPSQPADVNAQTRLIESNQAAINYTKRDAKRDPVSDAGKVYNAPVMKDPVLNQVFENSGKAGVKTSSANDAMKVAAARAILSKLAADAADKAKKSKESAMGGAGAAPPPPGVPSPAFTQ